MIDTFVKFEEFINNCLLCRLSKPYLENEFVPEFQVRKNKLRQYFPKLMLLLENVDFRQQPEIASSTLYSLLILYLELKCTGPWNPKDVQSEDYTGIMNRAFQAKYNIELGELLYENKFYNAQEVFDKCIKELHQKMTLDDFRKYPGLIEVYCMLISNVTIVKTKLSYFQKCNVTINPVTVLPVALLLVDDFTVSNKVKGLQCCDMIFQCLMPNDFSMGNYYEVIYRSLKNALMEKDIEVTQHLFKCLPVFLNKLHAEVRKSKLDDVFASILGQLHTESNLYRKAECFDFTTSIIEMHGIHCVKHNIFKDIVSDNLDICTNEGVYEILAEHVLKCLITWIRHCWCVWKFPSDHKILSALFLILYVAKDETNTLQIQNIIITLIQLCTKDEQTQILNELESMPNDLYEEFIEKFHPIRQKILYLVYL